MEDAANNDESPFAEEWWAGLSANLQTSTYILVNMGYISLHQPVGKRWQRQSMVVNKVFLDTEDWVSLGMFTIFAAEHHSATMRHRQSSNTARPFDLQNALIWRRTSLKPLNHRFKCRIDGLPSTMAHHGTSNSYSWKLCDFFSKLIYVGLYSFGGSVLPLQCLCPGCVLEWLPRL